MHYHAQNEWHEDGKNFILCARAVPTGGLLSPKESRVDSSVPAVRSAASSLKRKSIFSASDKRLAKMLDIVSQQNAVIHANEKETIELKSKFTTLSHELVAAKKARAEMSPPTSMMSPPPSMILPPLPQQFISHFAHFHIITILRSG